MSEYQNRAESEIIRIKSDLEDKGYLVSEHQKREYCYEVSISKNNDKLKLQIYFGKKGIKKVLQGNRDTETYSEINGLISDEFIFEKSEFEEPETYIGTDESGKGDFFGPLIIAGVFVNEETKDQLIKIGVKDSKQISHNNIKTLANKIKKIVGGDSFNVVVINPPKYNELYDKFGNLNRLLAWGHARVLENILIKRHVTTAISDKFGNEKLIESALQEKGQSLDLHQFHKAEKYTAVAAASIIARDKFNDWFEQKKAELKTELPKGASVKVSEVASKVKEKFGIEYLSQLTKTHFKTSRTLR